MEQGQDADRHTVDPGPVCLTVAEVTAPTLDLSFPPTTPCLLSAVPSPPPP